MPSSLPSTLLTVAITHVVAVAKAHFVVTATPLAALAITLFFACHPCCCHHCPCCCCHLPTTVIAITIVIAALVIALFVACHLVADTIAHIICLILVSKKWATRQSDQIQLPGRKL
jgi:hypothetical protein